MSTSVALHLVIVVACGDDHEISANKFQVCSFQLPGLIRASKYHMSSWGSIHRLHHKNTVDEIQGQCFLASGDSISNLRLQVCVVLP